MAIADAGETRAWELLAACEPAAVCARAGVAFDPTDGAYRVPSFRWSFSVDPAARQILARERGGELFLKREEFFFRLTLLWYLVRASPARPTGTLVRPAALPGGAIFLRGTHVLPLDALAAKFAARPAAFLAAGAALGGEPAGYGDAAVLLHPLPKVPTTVLLWTGDDEFPARADLLFDATCTAHLPLDVLWSIAMLSVQALSA